MPPEHSKDKIDFVLSSLILLRHTLCQRRRIQGREIDRVFAAEVIQNIRFRQFVADVDDPVFFFAYAQKISRVLAHGTGIQIKDTDDITDLDRGIFTQMKIFPSVTSPLLT